MADTSVSFVRKEMLDAKAAPTASGNLFGWLHKNLLATPKDIVLTVLAIAILVMIVPPAANWLFFQASWFGSDRSVCSTLVQGGIQPDGWKGACWAFVKDRFEVVIAEDLADKDLAAAHDPYRTRPKWGPLLIGTQRPSTREERNDLVLAAMEGKDIQNFPRYFVPYEQVAAQVKEAASPLDKLYKRHPETREMIAAEHLKQSDEQLRWLPIRGTRSFWTVLVDANSGALLAYIPIDPYES